MVRSNPGPSARIPAKPAAWARLAAAAAAAAVLGAACGDSTTAPGDDVSVTVQPPTVSLLVGDTLRLTAVILDRHGDPIAGAVPTWTSLDANVASVGTTGLVTAEGPGATKVVAEFDGAADTAAVSVAGSASSPALELVVGGLSGPVDLRAPDGDDERLFVVQKRGDIVVVRDGAVLATPFLDLRPGVATQDERGLLSLVFHPDYASNGWFYVFYTRASDNAIRIERYTVSADPDVADPGSGVPIITVPHPPTTNHNGGQLHFGPDGYLYASIGDGGTGHDGNGQDTGTLLGTVIRLDVDGGSPYAIPPDNPFVGEPGADEIWAYGLRNPWRTAFDPATGDFYIADVGQAQREEVDVEPAGSEGGANYGWNRMEGSLCYPADPCDPTGLTLPVTEYSHDDGGCSITGGYVYRGPSLLALQGHYLYADFCSGQVWSFRYDGGAAVDATEWTATLSPGTLITSFGRDGMGELYILRGATDGEVHRIVPAGP